MRKLIARNAAKLPRAHELELPSVSFIQNDMSIALVQLKHPAPCVPHSYTNILGLGHVSRRHDQQRSLGKPRLVKSGAQSPDLARKRGRLLGMRGHLIQLRHRPLLDVSHGKVDLKALFCAIEPDAGPPVSQTASSKLQVDGVFKPLPLICSGGRTKGEPQPRVNRVELPLSSGDLSEVRAKSGYEKEQIGIFAVLRQREGIGL